MNVGAPGDLVIFHPEEEWTVGEFHSKSSNSPFVGWKLKGKVKWTICGGKVVYKSSEVSVSAEPLSDTLFPPAL